MADEIDWLDLPGRWAYGVDRGGRVFFINDEEKSTSWVHPSTDSPIQSGHSSSPELPNGWEMDSTQEGAVYFIKLQYSNGTEELPVKISLLLHHGLLPAPSPEVTAVTSVSCILPEML